MSSDDNSTADQVGEPVRFPDVCEGINGEEILALVRDGKEFQNLGGTASELVLLLQSLSDAAPSEKDLAHELVVIGAMTQAFSAPSQETGEENTMVASLDAKASGSFFKRLTTRSMVAAAATVFLTGSAAAAASGSLPKGVQNVVAKMVKAVSGVQLPDPGSTVTTKTSLTSTPTTASQNMVVPTIPSNPTVTSSTTTSTSIPASTVPTVARSEGAGQSSGDATERSNGSPIPSLPESSSTSPSDGKDQSHSGGTTTTIEQGSPQSTVPSSDGSGGNSSTTTTSTQGKGDSSGGGDH